MPPHKSYYITPLLKSFEGFLITARVEKNKFFTYCARLCIRICPMPAPTSPGTVGSANAKRIPKKGLQYSKHATKPQGNNTQKHHQQYIK